MSIEELLSLMNLKHQQDIDLVRKAYLFAQEAHKNEKRKNGDPYFVHLYETAKNLAEIGMGAVTVSAGLLHDSIEDVNVLPETIEREFGPDILFLVEGVTKLGKLRYRGVERHIESLRKLFVAMSQDIRVLIIKLADRLHNMRTLEFVDEHKRERIARETLEIYAPLSYRLGIRKFTRELQDLAFLHIFPKEYTKVKDILDEQTKKLNGYLEKFDRSLRKELAIQGVVILDVDYRVKNLYSLYKKLVEKEWDTEKIYDIFALRIVVPAVADCYRVLGIVHGAWQPLPGRIKDYIAFPKTNGYQSIHTTVFTGDGSIIEVQIRTEDMHLKAEYGIASHIAYKERLTRGAQLNDFVYIKKLLPQKKKKATETEVGGDDIPNWIKDLAESQATVVEEKEFMSNMKSDFFEMRVFVFTPAGDVVDLPTDATPIDFAYAIHSDIGDHMFGAKVNGKQVSLDCTLHFGDIIEIQTRTSAKPTTRWLDIAKTVGAKKRIRQKLEELSHKKL